MTAAGAAGVDVFINEDLELTGYYWPEATRQSAEDALKVLPVGSFLVRSSSKPACKALSHVVAPGQVGHALIQKTGDIVTLEATNREFSSVDQLVGMLNLQPAPLDSAQRDALDQRRRAVAQKRAEDKRREEQREQQAFQAMAEEEAEKKRQADAKLRAQSNLERQRREADEAERRALDEKRRRLAAMPKEDPANKTKQYASANRFQLHEIREIEAVFSDLDHGGVGGFDVSDVRRAFEQMGEDVSQQELEQFMAELGEGKGMVLFGAFLDAVDKLPDDALTFPAPNDNFNGGTNGSQHGGGGNGAPGNGAPAIPRRAISPGATRY